MFLSQISCFCLWAWFWCYVLRPEFSILAKVLQRHLLAGRSEAQRRRTSLDVAVVICAVGLRHIHLSHGLAHVVDAVPPRGHALVDAVQALSLLETGDLVLGGEATDGCGGSGTSASDK